LFGDTMNTAARMESNSEKGRIMCSSKTAEILIAAGKSHWLTLREDLVYAKGKGQLQCYWVCARRLIDDTSSLASREISSEDNDKSLVKAMALKSDILSSHVDWMVSWKNDKICESMFVTKCCGFCYNIG
jgi:Adenylate and Guanylate cyclase catalytic domain